MKKCDVVIPVYKSPEWVKLCVYSIFENTDLDKLNKVYLINDCDDYLTTNCLNNLASKYPKIEIIQNEKNLGFIGTTNKGMKASTADYVLLLNTDCIITKGTIEKLIDHCENNDKIGLICPVASNAANITLEMYPGFSLSSMNNLLERKFKGKNFDACTVVGNCLMITKDCIEKVGYLDEAYGMGYGEETDYQFKAMEKGFEAKIAIDTYVFHKSEASFGTSKEKQERLKKNRNLFFERWGEKYYKLMEKYEKNDPIKYINNHINDKDKEYEYDFLIYLIGFAQNAGGVHMTVDMINYLVIKNINCNVLYGFSNGYDEIMLFNPIQVNDINKYKFKKLVSTIYSSTYYVKELADKYNVPMLYFAQGYEPYFENGTEYGIAELSYKLPDGILTISNYLKNRYKDMFNVNATVIKNGINYDLLHANNDSKEVKVITLMLRNNVLKGDFILLDLAKKIASKYHNIKINILYSNKLLKPPFFDNKDNVTLLKGPFTRKEIADIMQKSDLYVDASFTEGFGLMPLEAMAAGNVVVASDSGGINEYLKDEENGLIVKEVNNIDKYFEKIEKIINDKDYYSKLKRNAMETVSNFDYDKIINEYIDFFSKEVKKKDKKLSDDEKELYDKVLDAKFKVSTKSPSKNLAYRILRKTPKGLRVSVKKGVEKLYQFTNVR